MENRVLTFEEKLLLRNLGRAMRRRGVRMRTLDLGLFLYETEINDETFSERQSRDLDEFVWKYRDWSAKIVWTVTGGRAIYEGEVQAPDLKTFEADLMLLKLTLI